MADVQTENGYTKVANELLEKIQDYKFTINQLKIILTVWRYTYGFNRKEHELSLGFLQKATNLTRTRVNESLQTLLENKVVILVKKGGTNHQSKIIAFNKNYDDWQIEKYAASKKRITSVQNDTSVQDDTRTSVQNDTRSSVQDDTQERKSKEKYKENIYIDFPIDEHSFLIIYNQHYFDKFHKNHMRVTNEQKEFIMQQISEMELLDDIDHEEFAEITTYHFDNLSKTNNGNIIAFIHAFPRYLNILRGY